MLPRPKAVLAVSAHWYVEGTFLTANERYMEGSWFRCKGETGSGYRVELHWLDGRLNVGGGWDGSPIADVWLASTRRVP